ncbi:MAG: hypothetical protein WAN86_14325 [Hyphomicrobiaceae bacterium]
MHNANDLLHFVGSLPYAGCEDVFRNLGREVGAYLRRMPDGETGERIKWIVFQQRMLQQHGALEVDTSIPPLPVRQSDGTVHRHIERVRIKPGVDPGGVTFDTGYDRAAIASYQVFRRLRDEGIIPPHVRFQLALPTPLATGLMYVSPNGREEYLRAYERSLLQALDAILSAIPNENLSIQFDVCQEVLLFEGYFPEQVGNSRELTFGQLARLSAAVPADAELGFHLCYGSPGDQPLVSLRTAAVLVELMNGIAAGAKRKVDFIHIPVPRLADASFFAPLRLWQRPAGTRLYLGLLQFNDPEGDRRRIALAREVLTEFGVAAECGFGRTDPARLPALLANHRAAAEMLRDEVR